MKKTYNANGGFHESREGGKHIDGRVDEAIVQLAIDVDLALGDVTSQIGDRVSDVCTKLKHDYVCFH